MTQQPTDHQALNQDLILICADPWGRDVAVPTTLGYRHEDPYAVTVTFHSYSGDVDWIVSRMLLLQGLAAPAGEGDVRIYPSIDDQARATVVLDFCSPDGRLIAEADAHGLQTFLARTFAAVPAGTESDYFDVDALVAQLLGTDA
jgi:hypothetical protein